jgi:hypothetical protein
MAQPPKQPEILFSATFETDGKLFEIFLGTGETWTDEVHAVDPFIGTDVVFCVLSLV